MKKKTSILLLMPPAFVLFSVFWITVTNGEGQLVFYLSILLSFVFSVGCLLWGIRIFKIHRKLAWITIILATLYLLSFLGFQPAT